ncbi:hypothetical protein L0P85_10370 [Terrisporobacter glycolicus]|nr:hypothetical protein L0P85_10370 [Terrisporobacter glycolicus]
MNNAITSLTTDVENLFLNYDISEVNISQLEETLNAFSDKIEECKKNINNIE